MANKPSFSISSGAYLKDGTPITTPFPGQSSTQANSSKIPSFVEEVKKIFAEKDCPSCNGRGRDKDGYECVCLLKQRALQYLTPKYASAEWDKNLDVSVLENKNVLFQNISLFSFQSIVKSFLLNTHRVHKHISINGYDLFSKQFKNGEDGEYTNILNHPLLFLYLNAGMPIKVHTPLFVFSLEVRLTNCLPTWVYSALDINSEKFKSIYTIELTTFLKNHYLEFKK